ncbi:MAG: hypothetical protein AAB902_00055 [Patescibacteria group bacterium]
MLTKHFFKILMIFTMMIILGLIGIVVLKNFDQNGEQGTEASNQTPVAK